MSKLLQTELWPHEPDPQTHRGVGGVRKKTRARVFADCVGTATRRAFSNVENLPDLRNCLLRGAVLFMNLVDIVEKRETYERAKHARK